MSKFIQINKRDRELIGLANNLVKARKGNFTSVGAALRTSTGQIYTGVNIEQIYSHPCSTCAEYTAIGKMHTDKDQEIESLVVVNDEERLMSPCGKCREMIKQFGNPFIILEKEGKLFKIKADELVPYWEIK